MENFMKNKLLILFAISPIFIQPSSHLTPHQIEMHKQIKDDLDTEFKRCRLLDNKYEQQVCYNSLLLNILSHQRSLKRDDILRKNKSDTYDNIRLDYDCEKKLFILGEYQKKVETALNQIEKALNNR